MARRYTGGFLSTKEQATDSNTANGVFTLAEAQEKTALGNFPTGRWTPQRSLRFRSSPYLNRSFAADGNRTKWTWSFWVKRSKLGDGPELLSSAGPNHAGGADIAYNGFNGSDQFIVYMYPNGGPATYNVTTNRVFRDPSAWYHIVVAFDTSQSVSTDRIKIYVNGVLETSMSSASYPSQNYSGSYINSTRSQVIGQEDSRWRYPFDGYLAEFNFIDGQYLDPTYFGFTDPQTGTWVPKLYTGTYGNNGYYLPFSNNGSTTALGLDMSPSKNMVTYSEQLDNAAWVKGNATVTANAVNDPLNATLTADKIIPTSTNGYHTIYQGVTVQPSTYYTMSFYGKTAGYGRIQMGDSNTVGGGAYFDLNTGSLYGQTTSNDQSLYDQSANIQSVGNGWYRCTITFKTGPSQSGINQFLYIVKDDGTTSYAGDTTSGVYLWGMQVNVGKFANTYVTTTSAAVQNDWTPNSFSVTAGTTNDSMVDVPGVAAVSAQNDVGGVVRGNYCTMNSAFRIYGGNSYSGTFSNGNLSYASSGNPSHGFGTLEVPSTSSTGYYWEVLCTSVDSVRTYIGIIDPYAAVSVASDGSSYSWPYKALLTSNGGYVYDYSGGTGGGASTYNTTAWGSYTTNDVIMVAYKNGNIWWGKNGVWLSGNPALNTSPMTIVDTTKTWLPYVGYSSNFTVNFGQRAFSYTPPAGFKSLCTTNLPNPVIKKPADHFDVKTWTGNGTSLVVGSTVKQTSAIQVSNSLKFKDNNNTLPAYLETYPNTTGSQTTWTLSFWAKRGKSNYSTYPWIISADNNTGNADGLRFINTDNIDWIVNGSQVVKTGNVFSNTQLWNHFLFVWDTTQSPAANRQRIFVNGVRVTNLTVANYVSQNATSKINTASYLHRIGTTATTNRNNLNTEIFDGYLAEWNFIDSAAMSPSDFGQFDANNNWVPKTYTGSYGTTGYYLPFSAPTAFGTSSYSVNFTGQSSQYLSLPDSEAFNFGSGDFTIEAWVNMPAIPGIGTTENCVFSQSVGGAASDSSIYFGAAGQQQASLYITPGTTWTYNATGGYIPAGQWTHIMGVRNGTSLKVYVNGVNTGSTTLPAGYTLGNSTRTPTIGLQQSGSVFYGRISNLRIIKGQAIVTGNFTPYKGNLTTSAIGHTGAGVAGSLTGTCSLLTCQSSTFVDNSSNNFTITNNGSVVSPVVDYPWAKGVFSDRSGNEQHWASFGHAVTAPTVLTYATPGTYTWTAPAGVTSVEVLVVGGGGGGATGGGGAGGVIYNTSFSVTPSSNYTVTVGAGGTGTNNGSNSVFSSLTAVGGGYGANSASVGSGGSGGGGYYGRRSDGLVFGPTANGTGTAGQGFAGGNYTATGNPPSSSYAVGAGGGGAGGVGFTNSSWTGGHGGPGLAIPITGVIQYFAGGGGGQGGYAAYGGYGGFGGGGTGYGDANTSSGTGGVDGTGGGAGGGSGKAGGCGIVILKYTNAYTYTGTGANAFSNQDNVIDTITDYTDSYGDHGNYCIWNSSNKSANVTVSNGGLKTYGNGSNTWTPIFGTLGLSAGGKWYWEHVVYPNTTAAQGYCKMVGIVPSTAVPTDGSTAYLGNTGYGYGLWIPDGSGGTAFVKRSSSSNTTLGSNYALQNGDVIQVAYDAVNGNIWFGKNNTWFEGSPSSGTSPSFNNIPVNTDWIPALNEWWASNMTYNYTDTNFGQTPFKYAPPTGFKGLTTKNLKDVGGYNLPDTFGNFVNTPDLVWIKNRSSTYNHILQDTVRGTSNYLDITTTALNSGVYSAVQAFLPNGFQIGSISGGNLANNNIVAWTWNRGTTPGFDIVSFASPASGAYSVKHNLGVTPAMMIIKDLSAVNDWYVWHESFSNPAQGNLRLNTTAAVGNSSAIWNNTAPDNSYFYTQANTVANANSTGVAYLWAEVPGFSRFGSYVGNGSADGPFVYTGFRPKWILVKSSTEINNWWLYDVVRDTINPMNNLLRPDLTNVDTTQGYADFVSNGFKIRNTGQNNSGQTYVYACFAEAPFKYATAR